ncbi:ABC transporter permease [Clostridium ganghwense]|uniref:ABC transporter permease n=1 Tax=Clostridium ganghwense TaxID=312089 RepID=A0ABT4CUT5_9CLOT|nr:ABC transporter permease [Clostridium ganghwense]
MQLFNIAFSNVKKNFKNYFIYIFSIIFSVTIYFIFKSIEHNNEINKALLSVAKLNDAFKAAAIVIALFSAVFIWYSNSFFIRKRKKEIGLYSILGIEKKQIGRMLFYETLAIGTISLGIGIIVGIVLSKIFIGILIKLIGIPTVIKFTISFKAIKETITIFFILFIIISVHGYSIIYRYELIELFKAENKREKEPKTSLILAMLSLILIGSGYFIYNLPGQDFMVTILITLILVVSGTYILFGSCIIFVIKASKKNEKKYFKGLNMIATSQLLYRIKGNSKTLATIAILSASTLTAMGVSVSYYKNFSGTMNKTMPFSYVSSLSENNFDKQFKSVVSKHKNNKLLSEVHVNVAKVHYKIGNDREMPVSIISQSKLKEIFKARKLTYDLPSLKSEKEVILFDEMYNSKFMDSYKDKQVTMNFENSKEKFNILDFRDYPLFNEHMLFQTVVVKDSIFDKYNVKGKAKKFDAYIINDQNKSESLDKEVNDLYQKIKDKAYYEDKLDDLGTVSSYYSVYKETSVMTGVILFIGIFLGLVFLICTGSIIFFKQLSEAQEEVGRYDILRKVGADNREIKMSIFKQMIFVFLTPFVVGTIHSLVAVSLFTGAFKVNLLDISILTTIPYLVIYLIYYFVTSNFYYKTVTRES